MIKSASVSVNLPTLAFTMLVTLLTGVVFGVLPALQVTRRSAIDVLLKVNTGMNRLGIGRRFGQRLHFRSQGLGRELHGQFQEGAVQIHLAPTVPNAVRLIKNGG